MPEVETGKPLSDANATEVVTDTPNLATMQRADTVAIWGGFKAQLEKLKATAETLTVTDVKQTAEMKIARTTRLTLRELRVAVEHKRKELVEEHLRAQQQINSDAKQIKDYCEKLEARLLEQEQFIALENARIENENRDARTAELVPFLTAPIAVDLGKMSQADYAALLADAKAAFAAKIERERKEREAAEAAEKAERERIEAQRLENERLKKEAAEREEAARKEREAAAAALAKEREEAARLAREAQAKADAEAKKIREEAAERAREAAAKAKVEADKARKEREAIEAKAKADREAAEAKARAEREAAEAVARKEREAREKVEAELAAKKAAEERAAKERIAAEKKAAAAPDKRKLTQLAEDIRMLVIPDIKNAELRLLIGAQREKFAEWVEKQADALKSEAK